MVESSTMRHGEARLFGSDSTYNGVLDSVSTPKSDPRNAKDAGDAWVTPPFFN